MGESSQRRRFLLTSRQWFVIHSWLGLKFAILLSVILISGTIATLGHEIHWLSEPKLRVTPADTEASWGTMAAAVQSAYPDRYLYVLGPRIGPRFAVEAMTFTPEGAIRYVYVDPYTGQVTGDTYGYNVRLFLRHLHRFLFMGDLGLYIVSFFSLFLLASLITGLVAYKRFWRGFFKRPRARNARMLWGDLHRLAGLWSLWFILAIALTGGWYLVEQLMTDAGSRVNMPTASVGEPGLAAAARNLDERGAPQRISIDEAVAVARQEIPGIDITAITMPADIRDPIRIKGHTDAVLVRDNANAVYVDPYSGGLLLAHRAESLGPGLRLLNTVNPLHFGDFGGLTSKLIWFVFGLVISGMAISGAIIWTKRTARLREEEAGGPVMMGRWKYLNVLFLLPMLVLIPVFISNAGPKGEAGESFPAQSIAGCALRVQSEEPLEAGRNARMLLAFERGCVDRFSAVYAEVIALGEAASLERPVARHLGVPVAKVAMPDRLEGGAELVITAEGWTGRRREARWPISTAESASDHEDEARVEGRPAERPRGPRSSSPAGSQAAGQ